MDFDQKHSAIQTALQKIMQTLSTTTDLEGENISLEEFQLQMMLFVAGFGGHMRDLMRVANEVFEFDQTQWIEQLLCTLEDKPEMLDSGYKLAQTQEWSVVCKPVRGAL